MILESGASAPEVVVPGTGGDALDVANSPSPLLIAFFKVSCPVCQLTFPYLDRIAQSAGGLRIVGISQDGPKPTAEFARTFGVTFPVYLDDSAAGYRASNAFGITHVPSLFLVENGRIAEAFSGFSRSGLAGLAERFRAPAPFAPGEQVPEFRPG